MIVLKYRGILPLDCTSEASDASIFLSQNIKRRNRMHDDVYQRNIRIFLSDRFELLHLYTEPKF